MSHCDVIPKLVSIVLHLRSLHIYHKYPTDSISAMEKTVCWMDMPSDTTVAHTGSYSISLKTTGHEKDHFTVILLTKANGTKLNLLSFSKASKVCNKSLVVVKFSNNGRMNDMLIIDYLYTLNS